MRGNKSSDFGKSCEYIRIQPSEPPTLNEELDAIKDAL